MFDELAAPIAVVAHDAGAANHIVAWLQASPHVDVRPCMQGPALAIWRQTMGDRQVWSLATALDGARTLLSGTGWASDLEHDARRWAEAGGLRTIAVIDHWTNYRDRFERAGHSVLPDEIWVTDSYAQQLAGEELPGVLVRLQPNCYLEGVLAQVPPVQRESVPRVLYLMEPIRAYWAGSHQTGEWDALDFFASNLGRLGLTRDTPIRIRPHPSDPEGKYDTWISGSGLLKIELDPMQSLPASIAWSTLVAGCQTYAMVLAAAAGRRVISTLPPAAPRCVLPQREIIHLSDLESLKGQS